LKLTEMKSSSAQFKDPCDDGQRSFQAIRIILICSFDPRLFPRKADVRLMDEQTSLDPFDDHTDAQFHLLLTLRGNLSPLIPQCKRTFRKFHKFLLETKTVKPLNLGKVREVHLSLQPSSLATTARTEKQSGKEMQTLSRSTVNK